MAKLKQYFQGWAAKRSPRAAQVVLQHRTIYVFPSRQGMAFLILVGLIWLLGTNYQNNLILGFAFLLASLMVISVIHAFKNLLGLCFSPAAVQHAQVGDLAAFDINISSLYGYDHYGLQLSLDTDEIITTDLIAGAIVQVRLRTKARHRGWLKMPQLLLKSYFPLGLIRAWAYINLEQRALIFPKPIACEQPPLGIGQGEDGSFLAAQRGDEFHGFQTYQPGSPLTHIAWKQYARGAGMHLKDYRAQHTVHYWLDWQVMNLRDTELALSHLSYWVNYFSNQHVEFGLRMPQQTIALGSGDIHRLNALTALALFGWVDK